MVVMVCPTLRPFVLLLLVKLESSGEEILLRSGALVILTAPFHVAGGVLLQRPRFYPNQFYVERMADRVALGRGLHSSSCHQ